MAAWLRGEEKGPERQQWKRGAEEMDKVGAAPGVTVESLRRLGAALIENPEREYGIVYIMIFFVYKCERGICDPERHRMARGSSFFGIYFFCFASLFLLV